MLYEITAEQEHINLIKKALQSYICSIYDALDEEVVDKDKAHEDIKVLSDMLAVLKGQSNYKQTSESVGLMWMREIDLEEMSNDSEYIDTSKSEEERQKEINEKVRQAKEALNTFSYTPMYISPPASVIKADTVVRNKENFKEKFERYRRNIQIF